MMAWVTVENRNCPTTSSSLLLFPPTVDVRYIKKNVAIVGTGIHVGEVVGAGETGASVGEGVAPIGARATTPSHGENRTCRISLAGCRDGLFVVFLGSVENKNQTNIHVDRQNKFPIFLQQIGPFAWRCFILSVRFVAGYRQIDFAFCFFWLMLLSRVVTSFSWMIEKMLLSRLFRFSCRLLKWNQAMMTSRHHMIYQWKCTMKHDVSQIQKDFWRKKMTDWQTLGLWMSAPRSTLSFKITLPTLRYWAFFIIKIKSLQFNSYVAAFYL